MRPALTIGLMLAAAVGCTKQPGMPREEGFNLIHVKDLVALRASAKEPVTVLDANRADFRQREGIIPGAILLSAYKDYDLAELPPKRDARLVFYCADSH